MGKLAIEELAGTLEIKISPTKLSDLPTGVFLFIWLIGWAFGEVFALTTLFASNTPWFVMLFLIVWLTGWTMGGAFAIAHLVRLIGGRERIELGRGMLRVSKGFVLFKLDKQYDTFRITDLHVMPKNDKKWNLLNSGVIQFKYEEKDIRFGNNLSPEERQKILNSLRQHQDLNERNFR